VSAALVALSSSTYFVSCIEAGRQFPRAKAARFVVLWLCLTAGRRNVSPFTYFFLLFALFVCSLHAQTGTPALKQQPPKAIYTPAPVYRPEWAKQGLAGKGVVLVTIDEQTGKVTGVRMVQSTGNEQLDGAALEAYSQWRFQPGTGSQVKIPIEFANRPRSPAVKRTGAYSKESIYAFLILVGFGVAIMAMRKKKRPNL
jgi:TonB family protein